LTNCKIKFTFFGGEPLLNVSAIETICNVGSGLVSTNNNTFSFALITNGTILNNRILNLIKKFEIAVRISIDGPKEIHNMLRKFLTGKGSFDIISSHVRRIKEASSVPVRFEATYTSLHEEAGISREDCVKFLTEEVGFQGGLIANVYPSTPQTQFLQPHSYILDDSLKSLEQGGLDDWAFYPFHDFVHKNFSKYICGIGNTHFIVTPNGDFYPCQLFVGDKKFFMGNIKYPELLSNEYLNLIDKEKNVKCKFCWAKYLCRGCPGIVYKKTGQLNYTDEECSLRRKNYEKLLAKLGEIRCDEEKYNRLIRIIEEKEKYIG